MKRILLITLLSLVLLLAACSSSDVVTPPDGDNAPVAPSESITNSPQTPPPSEGPSLDSNLPSKEAYEAEEGKCADVIAFHEGKLAEYKEELAEAQKNKDEAQAQGDAGKLQNMNKEIQEYTKKISIEEKILAKAKNI